MILTARRPFILLEVLIAFVFVVSAFFPLVYPHFYIFQQQRKFIEKIEVDNAVNDFYAIIIEQLQQNQISWQSIEDGQVFPLDETFWRFPKEQQTRSFRGTYRFKVVKKKQNENYELCQVELSLVVNQRNPSNKSMKDLTYTYQIFMARLLSKA